MTRYKAAAIHFGISVAIVTVLLLLMRYVWYPKGYFDLLSGGQLLYIIMGVDVTLGPLLTLVVFKNGKKGLKFDLALIGAVQLCALIYGANVMFQSRPVYAVFEQDVIKVSLASDFQDDKELRKANAKWQKLSITGPVMVAAKAPTNKVDIDRVKMAAAAGLDWNFFPWLYIDYDAEQRALALKNGKTLSQLRKASKENIPVVDKFLMQQNKPETAFVYLPIVISFTDMAAILDAKTAEFIQIIPTKEN